MRDVISRENEGKNGPRSYDDAVLRNTQGRIAIALMMGHNQLTGSFEGHVTFFTKLIKHRTV